MQHGTRDWVRCLWATLQNHKCKFRGLPGTVLRTTPPQTPPWESSPSGKGIAPLKGQGTTHAVSPQRVHWGRRIRICADYRLGGSFSCECYKLHAKLFIVIMRICFLVFGWTLLRSWAGCFGVDLVKPLWAARKGTMPKYACPTVK